MSQESRILAHLRAGRVTHGMDALKRWNTWRLAARVWSLRMQGWDIRTRRLKTRSGKRIAIYYLNPQ